MHGVLSDWHGKVLSAYSGIQGRKLVQRNLLM